MSEQTPVQLIVAAFKTESGADDALQDLLDAKKEHLLKINEVAVVRRDTNSKLHIQERGDIGGGTGAASGAALGAVIGLFGGPVGAVIGGAVGAAIGGLAGKLIDTGIPDDRLKEIGAALQPGTSALVAMIEDTWVNNFKADLAKQGGDILTQAISEDIANSLASGKDVAYTALAGASGVAVSRVASDGTTTDAEGTAPTVEDVNDTTSAAADAAGDAADAAADAASDAGKA